MKKRLHIALPLLASSLLLGGCGATYNIRFVDEDGTELFFGEFKKGETPKYNAATPTKASTNTTNYTFAGWDKTVGPATEATTYTATYKESVRKYNVKFLDSDGSVLKSIDAEYNSLPTPPNEPTGPVEAHKVFTFEGWDKQISPVTSDAVYTATYSYKYVYNFEFHDKTTKTVELDEGVSIQQHYPANTKDYNDNDKHIRYEFSGWTSEDGYNFTEKVKTTDIVLLKYSITVVDGSGNEECTNNNPTYVPLKTNLQLKDAVLEGYDFHGWYPDELYVASPVNYINDISEDYSLYGKFLLHTYNVSYELNGGENNLENPTTYNVKEGTVALKDPIKYGYAFDKWVIKGNNIKKSSINIKDFAKGDITLEALWKANTVKATFKLNGGYYAKTVIFMDGNKSISEQQIDKYKCLEPITYEKDGYQLAGWSKTKNSKELYDFNETISDDMKLYAVLVPIEKGNISGEINGTNNISIEGLKTRIVQVTSMIDQKLTFESKSSANTVGYLFGKSAKPLIADNDSGEDTNFKFSYDVKKGETYYLNIRGDSNEESGDAAIEITTDKASILPTSNVYGSYDDSYEVTFTFGEKALTLPAPTKEGYTFEGWKSESGEMYDAQTDVTVNEPIVLTAMWGQEE